MFSVIGEKSESNNVTFLIIAKPNANKVDNSRIKKPVVDLRHRMGTRLRALHSNKHHVSEITFRNFSMEALNAICKRYYNLTNVAEKVKHIFNIISEKYYDPACVILEEIPSENDFATVVNGFVERVNFTSKFKLLVLRNFNQNQIESLSNIEFPSRLSLRIEHSDTNMLENFKSIKLKAKKVEFCISNPEVAKKKSKKTKSKVGSKSSRKSKQNTDVLSMDELSVNKSDHDLNTKNMTVSNGEKDSNKCFPNNTNIETGSVSPINQLLNTSLANQSGTNATSAIAVPDASLDIFRTIGIITSDFKKSLSSSNHPFFKTLDLIQSIAGAPLAKSEHHQNITNLKNQINALNEELKIKAFEQEKARALQDEITSLKQDNLNLKSELAAIASKDKSQLVQCVIEVSQLREKSQQHAREIEDLNMKLSAQKTGNKRKRDEEEIDTANKVPKNVEQNSNSNNLTRSPYNPGFFPSNSANSQPNTGLPPSTNSLQSYPLMNNNQFQYSSYPTAETSSSGYSSAPQYFSNSNSQASTE